MASSSLSTLSGGAAGGATFATGGRRPLLPARPPKGETLVRSPSLGGPSPRGRRGPRPAFFALALGGFAATGGFPALGAGFAGESLLGFPVLGPLPEPALLLAMTPQYRGRAEGRDASVAAA